MTKLLYALNNEEITLFFFLPHLLISGVYECVSSLLLMRWYYRECLKAIKEICLDLFGFFFLTECFYMLFACIYKKNFRLHAIFHLCEIALSFCIVNGNIQWLFNNKKKLNVVLSCY